MRRCLAFLLSLAIAIDAAPITVDTTRGSLQGFDYDFGTDTSKPFYGYGQVFLGIPYAKPPLGQRRFTLPEDICQYTDDGSVYNASFYRPRCFQVQDDLQPAGDFMSEDCLHLNVVTPDVKGNYPVMVYIHGGTLTTGGADVYHWKGTIRNLVSRGVVVVTIQYRIGLFGFFTTMTDRFPPNRGMFDQILALKWVQEEISSFGGDPGRVTIFGQSAGAVSVSFHSLSPLSKGLFHQLIQTSGAALLEIETPDDPRGSIHKMRAKQVCAMDDSNWGSEAKDNALMTCLLASTAEDIIQYDFSNGLSWNVVFDGAFLPDYPETLAKQRPHYPVIFIDMLEESAFFVPGLGDSDDSNVGRDTIVQVLKNAWPNYDQATDDHLAQIGIDAFGGGVVPADDDHLGWSKLITNILTGLNFDATMLNDIKWHQANGNEDVWLFTQTHISKLSYDRQVEGWIPVAHCNDLPFVWFYEQIWANASVITTADDLATAENFGRIWTDFAKNGKLDFTRAGSNRNYLEMDSELTAKSHWRETAAGVYSQVVDYLGEFPPISMPKETWDMLNDLGKSTLSRWNSLTCPVTSPTVSPTTSTTSIPTISLLIIGYLAFCF